MATFPSKLLAKNPAWAKAIAEQTPIATAERRRPSDVPEMNATERRYADRLRTLVDAGEVLWFAFNEVRLRVGVGAYYKPDFFVQYADGRIECHETKGFEREAAMVRIKAAANLFPRIAFVLVKRQGGQWAYEQIGGGK